MNLDRDFLQTARQRYDDTLRRACAWQLSRMRGDWIDTKLHSVTLRDYTDADGLRGPAYRYGWIQGRGLEAMILHARYFERSGGADAGLAAALFEHAERLYAALDSLTQTGRRTAFCYAADGEPVCTGDADGIAIQVRDADIATYSDIFIVKGLVAAASHCRPDALPALIGRLDTIVERIDADRFLRDERSHITQAALARQTPDFAPRMIALGAAALLHQLGLAAHDHWSRRYIDHVLARHWHADSGLLREDPQRPGSNPGHAIEFCGLALETLQDSSPDDAALLDRLDALLQSSWQAAFTGYGLRLHVTDDDLDLAGLNAVCPWWSLPETIRSAARLIAATRRTTCLPLWRQADDTFYTLYWRDDPPLAFQSRDETGPVDYVPATPDLDPGYHTGLSLLSAIEAIDRLLGHST